MNSLYESRRIKIIELEAELATLKEANQVMKDAIEANLNKHICIEFDDPHEGLEEALTRVAEMEKANE